MEEVGGDLYDYIPFDPLGIDETRETLDGGCRRRRRQGNAGRLDDGRDLARKFATRSVAESRRKRFSTRVNRQVWEAEFDCRFVTLVLTELDSRLNRLTIANGGHPLPLSAGPTGRSNRLAGRNRVSRWASRPMRPTDRSPSRWSLATLSFFYSDGVPDARPKRSAVRGTETSQSLAQAPKGVAAAGEAILAAVHEHASGRSQFDDITLLCFGRNVD